MDRKEAQELLDRAMRSVEDCALHVAKGDVEKAATIMTGAKEMVSKYVAIVRSGMKPNG